MAVIVWLNGTFGVGKTTTANLLRQRDPGLRIFDPEWVGYLLRAHFGDLQFSDFQDLPSWRRLVPVVGAEIGSVSGSTLLAVQTVLVEQYWDELSRGMRDQGLDVCHVVLDASGPVLRQRIAADTLDPGARQWRLDHVSRYEQARGWMTASADLVVRTDGLTAADVAERIISGLGPLR